MDFLPGLIHGTIELMFLDPPPSILSDRTHFQFGLTFSCAAAVWKTVSVMWFVVQCVCVVLVTVLWADGSTTDPRAPASEHQAASITLTDCFLNVDEKDDLSASAWVAEQVINTKHFPYCTSSLNVELTPVSVCCQQSAIYPGLIDRTRAWPRPSETSAAPHNTDDHLVPRMGLVWDEFWLIPRLTVEISESCLSFLSTH